MLDGIQLIKPDEIEKRSFEIITETLGNRSFPPLHDPVIKRVIHTTADFEYADTLKISEGAVEKAMEAVRLGCSVITDTRMASVGINRKVLGKYGGKVMCYMDDENIASEAKEKGVTRATICMERGASQCREGIFAIGNAPTALLRLVELIKQGDACPTLVVGVPVGFVNVVESKQLLKIAGVPYILSEGRKGGSNVAAAIVNAILYMADKS